MENVLIIAKQQSTVTKTNERLIVGNDEGEKEVLTKGLKSVIAFGNVQFTSQALTLLANKKIPVSFISPSGKLKYFVLPPIDKNIDLRFAQYKYKIDEEKKLLLAKYFVLSKMKSSENLLREIRTNRKSFKLSQYKKETKRLKERVKATEKKENLFGFEGHYSRIYFSYLAKISNGEVKFTQRSKRPPKDEANALLGYIYTVTLSLITGIAYAEGFDVYAGFLHADDYARTSFALDVLEIFRAKFCDRFFINLTNKKIIKKSDFQKQSNGGYLMTDRGKQKFFEQWRKTVYVSNVGEKSVVKDIADELMKLNKWFRHDIKPEEVRFE